MNTPTDYLGYKVGDKVHTTMGVGIIKTLYMAGCSADIPAATVDHGPRNNGCPMWLSDIIGKAESWRVPYSL